MTTTEDYCSYEIAKLLKEKGFDGVCDYAYSNKGNYFEIDRSNFDEVYCLRPTHQMAMKWLREEHKIFIYIEPFITTSGLQGYKPYCTKIGGEFMWINPLRKYSNTSSDTYENAVEAALKYCLENLI